MYHFLISLADIICTGFYKAPLLKSTSSTCFSFLYVFSAQLGPQDPQQHHLLRSCRLTYRHKHAPQPHQWIQHKHRCIRANFSPSSIHPSFHPIHPSRLTSEEDGATDAALASAAPPLKGHTCSLRRGAIFCWNDRWHQNKILEKRRQNCGPERWRLTPCLSIADLRSCCRLYILPDNTESRAHAQWRRTVGHVTRSWLRCCCWLRKKRIWLWLLECFSLSGFACDEPIGVQLVRLLAS